MISLPMSRRLRRFPIPTHILADAFKDNDQLIQVVTHGLPEDATVRYTYNDPITATVYAVVHSESFEEVPRGEMIPEHPRPWVELVPHG